MSETIEKNNVDSFDNPDVNATSTPVKKSWFNRVWSAMTGLIVGIAAMFGIKEVQINEIKENVKTAYDQVQNVKNALENKDFAGATDAIGKAGNAITNVIGDVKETIDVAKETWEVYKVSFNEIKVAMDANNHAEAHTKAVALADKILNDIPEDQMTGKTKEIYNLICGFIDDVKNGKYDAAIETINSITALFNSEK